MHERITGGAIDGRVNRRRFLAVIAATAGGAILAACGGEKQHGSSVHYRLRLPQLLLPQSPLLRLRFHLLPVPQALEHTGTTAPVAATMASPAPAHRRGVAPRIQLPPQ